MQVPGWQREENTGPQSAHGSSSRQAQPIPAYSSTPEKKSTSSSSSRSSRHAPHPLLESLPSPRPRLGSADSSLQPSSSPHTGSSWKSSGSGSWRSRTTSSSSGSGSSISSHQKLSGSSSSTNPPSSSPHSGSMEEELSGKETVSQSCPDASQTQDNPPDSAREHEHEQKQDNGSELKGSHSVGSVVPSPSLGADPIPLEQLNVLKSSADVVSVPCCEQAPAGAHCEGVMDLDDTENTCLSQVQLVGSPELIQDEPAEKELLFMPLFSPMTLSHEQDSSASEHGTSGKDMEGGVVGSDASLRLHLTQSQSVSSCLANSSSERNSSSQSCLRSYSYKESSHFLKQCVLGRTSSGGGHGHGDGEHGDGEHGDGEHGDGGYKGIAGGDDCDGGRVSDGGGNGEGGGSGEGGGGNGEGGEGSGEGGGGNGEGGGGGESKKENGNGGNEKTLEQDKTEAGSKMECVVHIINHGVECCLMR